MESRIIGRFVSNGGRLEEVDSRQLLNDLIAHALGSPASGRLIKLTVTAETLTDKPWAACAQLGSYGENACGELLAPGTSCTNEHYHRPAWADDGTDRVCTACVALNLTPTKEEQPPSRYTYNHRNTPKSNGD